MVYRLDHGIQCEWWNWSAIIIQWATGFLMCLGAMLVVVGSATYLSVNRPDARSSVAASQRSVQMIFAAVSLALGGGLFETIGPGWMHSAMSACSAIFIPMLCCIDRDPTPKAAKEEEEEEEDSDSDDLLLSDGDSE